MWQSQFSHHRWNKILLCWHALSGSHSFQTSGMALLLFTLAFGLPHLVPFSKAFLSICHWQFVFWIRFQKHCILDLRKFTFILRVQVFKDEFIPLIAKCIIAQTSTFDFCVCFTSSCNSLLLFFSKAMTLSNTGQKVIQCQSRNDTTLFPRNSSEIGKQYHPIAFLDLLQQPGRNKLMWKSFQTKTTDKGCKLKLT